MHHIFTLALAAVIGLIGFGSEANTASRLHYRPHAERTGYAYWRYYGYPRPNCTFAIAQYQRRWPYQLWPPSMRCFPYPN
jgi:hypothetical protein